MPISVTDEQLALADAVRSWAQRARPVATARAMETETDQWRRLWPDLARLGILGLAASAADGGADG
ncbi:MAG TPA: acyl-CoA dehydrogenase family protein, partial [Jatrophihabitantaceae bacterium]|nr:acyl-CoA dehydrogenase family protein [Jatrophihabitantaceae bacterium]